MPEPPQLTPFDTEKQRFDSELLPDVQASHLISKAERGHPAEETHFSRLYLQSRSFVNHPTLMAIDRLSDRITADAALIRLSISRSILPSLVNKIARYLNSSTWGRTSSPTPRRHSTFFQARTILTWRCCASLHLLEVPVQWHQKNYVIRKKQRRDPPPTKLDTLHSRLCLEILSIKVMNRTGDKGQPWRSPTLTGNESDLQPAIRTKLLLFWYRDWTALIKGPSTLNSRSTPHRMLLGTRS
ncbi:hypothetical protein D4764_01G0000540 [Takifugu flavidus]|uniref:Uncharacterized protein n=1 Tax=Takifugu flavidus TaxID=433684 RepID=A0A5C6PMS4_9TELE|nr:hypothetical protein D4764_01G0000540 [Takifugu flavidus]